MEHVDKHSILSDCQHSFRAKRSCETQLFDLASTLDNGVQINIVVLDYSKAFDRVPHHRLLRSLQHYGIRGNTHQWITSFFLDRTQSVRRHEACYLLTTSQTRSCPRRVCLQMTALYTDQYMIIVTVLLA